MLYREAGQFKTDYASDQAIFPILQDRIGLAVILLIALADPARQQRLPDQRGDDPVPDLRAGRDRAQHPDRLYRPAVARHRRLHGGRRLCLLQAHVDLPQREHHDLGALSRASSRPRSARSSACRRCASRAFIWRSRRSPRSSSWNGASSAYPWLYNYNISGAIEVPQRELFGIIVTGPRATAETRYYIVLAIVVVMTWLASNLVHGRIGRSLDGGARHGHRRRAHRHPAAADQAPGLRGLARSTAASRAPDGVPLVRRRRADGLRHQPELPDPVHDHHRRAGQPARLLSRRGADLHPADRAALRCREMLGLHDCTPPPSSRSPS